MHGPRTKDLKADEDDTENSKHFSGWETKTRAGSSWVQCLPSIHKAVGSIPRPRDSVFSCFSRLIKTNMEEKRSDLHDHSEGTVYHQRTSGQEL